MTQCILLVLLETSNIKPTFRQHWRSIGNSSNLEPILAFYLKYFQFKENIWVIFHLNKTFSMENEYLTILAIRCKHFHYKTNICAILTFQSKYLQCKTSIFNIDNFELRLYANLKMLFREILLIWKQYRNIP